MIGIGGGIRGSLGPFISGWLHDVTDSYILSFMAAIISLMIDSALVWLAGPSKIRKMVSTKE